MKKIILIFSISVAVLLPLVSNAQDGMPWELPSPSSQSSPTSTSRNLSFSPSCSLPWLDEPTSTQPTEQNPVWENDMQVLEQSNASYLGAAEEGAAQGERSNPSNAVAMGQQTQIENNMAITSLCQAFSVEQQYCLYDQQYVLPTQCPQVATPISSVASVFVPDGVTPYAISLSPNDQCDSRYYEYGSQCVPLPSNAYATTDGWQCNQGYADISDQCVVQPNSTIVNGVDQCDAGYTDNAYGQCVQEQASTPSVPITPPVVSNVASPGITTSPTTSSVPAGTFTISQNLNVGASGQNVTDLQNFLIAKGFLTMPAGTNEGYFGGLTKRALISFQSSVGLPDTGYCGPMTRGVINTGN